MKETAATLDGHTAFPRVSDAPARSAPRVVIQPLRGVHWIDLAELWEYRALVASLTIRHIQVRYAQSVLGVGWAVVQPLTSMIVFTVIFAAFARVPSDGMPYQLFSLAALVPWTYFSSALTGASTSLSNSSGMLTKVYFPRLALPISHVAAGLVDFAIGLTLLLAMVFWYGHTPSLMAVAAVPILVAMMMLTAFGIGCGLAALDVQYRDVKHVIPFALQVWMYASPVVYSISSVPRRFHALYLLNPMAGILAAFRAVLLGTGRIEWTAVAMSLAVSLLLCAGGVLYFRHRERIFADVV
jgi:lipopolysaccharide transport system permease protein